MSGGAQAQGDLGQVLSRARGPRMDGWVGEGQSAVAVPGTVSGGSSSTVSSCHVASSMF